MPSNNDNTSTPEKPPTDVPPDDTKRPTPWFNHYHRCALFFLVEAAFIAFAAVLLKDVIPLPSFFTRYSATTVKSAVGTAFLLWHTLAVVCVADIFSDAFSREWLTNPQSPTDRVSTIRAGTVDRIFYFPFSTRTFKLTLCASLSTFILLRIGANTITIAETNQFGTLSIGGLILGSSLLSRNIMTMEYVNGLQLGYDTQPNWIIPKPAFNASQIGSLEYQSDIIHFNYSCQWHAPQFTNVSPQDAPVIIGDEQFDFSSFKPPPNSSLLSTTTNGTAFYPLLPFSPTPTAPSSAFLVFGGNSSFPLNSGPIAGNAAQLNVPGTQASGNTIDLSGLPTVYNESWFTFSRGRFKAFDGVNSLVFRAPLATALLCDPQPQLTTGTVNLSSNHLFVRSFGSTRRVGNLDASGIPLYFSYSLSGLSSPDSDAYLNVRNDRGISNPLLVDITPLAAFLLFSQFTVGANASIAPLPQDQIGKNMDALVLTASKAQVVDAGQFNPGSSSFEILPNSGPLSIPATNLNSRQALASNPVWFGVTTFAALLTLFLCLIISFRLAKDPYPPFDLDHIFRSSVRDEIRARYGVTSG